MTDIIDNGDFEVNPDVDHGALQGLSDDDHAQYALLAGRSGGQTLVGGTGPGDSLTLRGSSSGVGVSVVKLYSAEHLIPAGDNTSDLGSYVPGVANRFKDLYLAGVLSNGTAANNVTIAGCSAAYTHSQIGNVSPHVPTGSILMYGGATAPTGYLLCDGALVAVATYPALFAVLGYAYGGIGPAFGVPHFHSTFPKGYENGVSALGATGGAASNTPNFTGSALGTHVHTFTGSALGTHSHTPGISSDSAGTPAGTIGNTPGAVYSVVAAAGKPTFTGSAMLAHTHTPTLTSDSAGTPAGTLNSVSAGTPAGSISAVPTEPPYLVVNFIIKT